MSHDDDLTLTACGKAGIVSRAQSSGSSLQQGYTVLMLESGDATIAPFFADRIGVPVYSKGRDELAGGRPLRALAGAHLTSHSDVVCQIAKRMQALRACRQIPVSTSVLFSSRRLDECCASLPLFIGL